MKNWDYKDKSHQLLAVSHKLENRGYERCPLNVILNECEGFAAVMENTVKCHPERQRRIYYRGEEGGMKIKAISCELSATS